MTETLAPQEDQVHFPRAWERFVNPTRSIGKPRKVESHAEEGARLFAEHEAGVRETLDHMLHERLKPAAYAFLDGTPDPVGAAVVTVLICHGIGGTPHYTDYHESKDASSRSMVHHLIDRHGLPFAAAAAAVFFTLDTGRQPHPQVLLRQMHLNGEGWSRSVPDGLLRDLRDRFAAASDAEYAAVREALAAHRDNPAERVAVSLLAPDERAWTDEVCKEHQDSKPRKFVTDLLAVQAATTVEQLEALGLQRIPAYELKNPALANLIRRLGAAAAPILIDSVKECHHAAWRKNLHKALAMLPSDEAAGYFADRLHESDVPGYAQEFAQRFPLRTLRAVAARLPDAGPDRTKRLTTLLQADPAVEAAVPRLDAEARAIVEPLFASASRLPEADAADLPPLLVDPPWTVKAPKRKPVVIEGLEPPATNRVVWAEGERAAWGERGHSRSGDNSEEAWRKIARRLELRKLPSDEGLHFLAYAPLAIAAPVADRWHAREPLGYWAYELKTILSRFETAVSEQVVRGSAFAPDLREAALPIVNRTAARMMADAFVRLKSARETAVAWLDRHPADAAALLIPDALGKERKPRTAAEAVLRYVAAEHGAASVREAAAPYGTEAAAAIEALVDFDPLTPVGTKIPKPAAWASPALLPQVLLADGERALPQASVGHLLTILAIATPEYPYAGIEVVAEACDRESLTRFSLALFERWLGVGAPTAESWALTQLAHFADDHTVRMLAPLVAKWPGESQHQRAVKGLKVLGAIGSETALRAIQTIAEKAKFEAIKWEANDQIKAIAENLGLSRDQLSDRLLPDFGLGDQAAMVLDYGPRKFTVRFDEQLKPYVTDESGKPRKTLPKPGVKDDERIAGEAYQRFTALKKDLRTVAADLVKRLEAAMLQGRIWTPAEFRQYYVEHALSGHLARRLVWIAEHDGNRIGFRVAEDGSFSDVGDETVTLATDATIRVAHPALLATGDVRAWAELLADYEVLQPFDQMNRPVMAFTADEIATGRLTRFEGVTVEVGRILGMTNRGWDRTGYESGGVELSVDYHLPGGGAIIVDLDPGIYVGSVNAHPHQTIKRVALSGVEEYGSHGGTRPEGLDPVAVSEALAGLARLTATS
jgi:hypothetical protein